MAMISIELLFLLAVMTTVRSLGPKPNKANVCANPTFDAGLAFTESGNRSNVIKRYLFRDEYVLSFLWDSRQIDWQNIVPIGQKFGGSPAGGTVVPTTAVKAAFATKDKAFLLFKVDLKRLFEFKRNGDDFTFTQTVASSSGGLFTWDITTASAKTSTKKTMFFYDSRLPTTQPLLAQSDVTYKQGKIKISHNQEITQIRAPIEIFPNTLLYKNEREVQIPIEFDFYYETVNMETIFFKGDSACVYMADPKPYKQYCRTFVDTRTLIGCAPDKADSVPEQFPGEPDDIEPNL